MNREKMRP
jgi:hypothetical protein